MAVVALWRIVLYAERKPNICVYKYIWWYTIAWYAQQTNEKLISFQLQAPNTQRERERALKLCNRIEEQTTTTLTNTKKKSIENTTAETSFYSPQRNLM